MIDNSEIDVLLEQLSASDTWIYRFDSMKTEFLLRQECSVDGRWLYLREYEISRNMELWTQQ